jgi:putative flippase GtrA
MVSEFFDKFSNLAKFIKYGLIGLIGLILDMGLFYILHKLLGVNYVLSNIVSSSTAILHNFILNSYFTFRVTDKKFQRFLSFYGIALIGLVFSTLLLALFIDILGIDSMVSKLIAVFTIAIFQYFLNKKLTFHT